MKFTGYIIAFLFSSYLGFSQEIPLANSEKSGFIIKRLEIRPSLSNLAPEIPGTGKYKIRTVNFNVEDKPREVNIAEAMERERRMKPRTVDLDPPVQVPKQSGVITITGGENTRFNQSFEPRLNTTTPRGVRNSVYIDASESTGAAYFQSYSPFYRGYYY